MTDMSAKEPLRLFVMHAYQEHEEYARVFEYLESRANFYYVNFSDPDNKPQDGGLDAVQEHLRNQIEPAEVVLFPVGVHAQDPDLINFQLTVAQVFKKKILAIKSSGGTQAIPKQAMEAATETVEWNDRVITDMAKRLARGGDGAQWDTIDFDVDDLDMPE
jgi:Thoeris protein ThsB, TIR-like domain